MRNHKGSKTGDRSASDNKPTESNIGSDIQPTDECILSDQNNQPSNANLHPSRSEDGSDGLTASINEKRDDSGHPALEIYAGENGFLTLNENGTVKRKSTYTGEYPLPLDTDITEITAYSIKSSGDWLDIERIGDMAFTATWVELSDCWDLRELPKMNLVNTLELENCPKLKTLHPQTRVDRISLKNCGIQFLPKSLKNSWIQIVNCNDLQYIHPSIPEHRISLPVNQIRRLKFKYLLSGYATHEEGTEFFKSIRKVKLDLKDLTTLPAFLSHCELQLLRCPNLKYIHPAIHPTKITGLTPEEIYNKQMHYLFEKEKNDREFDKWFPIVRARGDRQRS